MAGHKFYCDTATAVEDLLAGGDEVRITRRKQVVARLLPPEDRAAAKRPDFLARLRKIYRHKRLAVSGTELLSAERRRD